MVQYGSFGSVSRERPDCDVFFTASEAYPAFERAWLRAETEIWAGFRIFDLATRLRVAASRRLGDSWFDLILDSLRRGVAVNVIVCDFDPLTQAPLHRQTWATMRQFAALRECAPAGAKLRAVAAMHPARVGLLQRLALFPAIRRKLSEQAAWLNAMTPAERARAWAELPFLRPHLTRDTEGRVAPRRWSLPQMVPATHHQKIAVFDRSQLYVGGIDLNERRYDTPQHDRAADETWQDIQLMVRGTPVAPAQEHLETFLETVNATRRPPPAQGRFLRTLSTRRPRGLQRLSPYPAVHEIAEAHAVFARESERLIYLETQFFRDRRLARQLARAAAANPRLSLILILPAAPENVAFLHSGGIDARYGEGLQVKCLKILRKAFGKRLFVGAPARPVTMPGEGRDHHYGAPIVYIHSKLSIFDRRRAIVSSANLNGRSLYWDTEAGVYLQAPAQVEQLLDRAARHWNGDRLPAAFTDPDRAVAAWSERAYANARRRPEEREGFMLPFDLGAPEAFGIDLPVIPEEMV